MSTIYLDLVRLRQHELQCEADQAQLAGLLVLRRARARISGWWSALAIGGQLGPDVERELGRRAGART